MRYAFRSLSFGETYTDDGGVVHVVVYMRKNGLDESRKLCDLFGKDAPPMIALRDSVNCFRCIAERRC